MFLEISQNSKENTSVRASFLIKLQASGECCEISKNTFFAEHLWTTASVLHHKNLCFIIFIPFFDEVSIFKQNIRLILLTLLVNFRLQ